MSTFRRIEVLKLALILQAAELERVEWRQRAAPTALSSLFIIALWFHSHCRWRWALRNLTRESLKEFFSKRHNP